MKIFHFSGASLMRPLDFAIRQCCAIDTMFRYIFPQLSTARKTGLAAGKDWREDAQPKICGICCTAIIFLATLSFGVGPTFGQTKTGSTTELDCLIEPYAVIKLGSPVDGIVEHVTVGRGDAVAKGQLIARLKSKVEEATVALSRARAGYSVRIQSSIERAAYDQRNLARARKLSEKKVISETAFDKAITELKLSDAAVAEAKFEKRIAGLELARAEALLSLRSIRSPVRGVVVKRLLSPGEYAHEQAQIVTIAQLDPLNVEVFVPIHMYDKIKKGMDAEVRPEQPVGGVYIAKVDVIDTVFDAASRTFGVLLLLSNPEYHLPAGLRCKVRFLAISD